MTRIWDKIGRNFWGPALMDYRVFWGSRWLPQTPKLSHRGPRAQGAWYSPGGPSPSLGHVGVPKIGGTKRDHNPLHKDPSEDRKP